DRGRLARYESRRDALQELHLLGELEVVVEAARLHARVVEREVVTDLELEIPATRVGRRLDGEEEESRLRSARGELLHAPGRPRLARPPVLRRRPELDRALEQLDRVPAPVLEL